jgi:hypothetical protein
MVLVIQVFHFLPSLPLPEELRPLCCSRSFPVAKHFCASGVTAPFLQLRHPSSSLPLSPFLLLSPFKLFRHPQLQRAQHHQPHTLAGKDSFPISACRFLFSVNLSIEFFHIYRDFLYPIFLHIVTDSAQYRFVLLRHVLGPFFHNPFFFPRPFLYPFLASLPFLRLTPCLSPIPSLDIVSFVHLHLHFPSPPTRTSFPFRRGTFHLRNASWRHRHRSVAHLFLLPVTTTTPRRHNDGLARVPLSACWIHIVRLDLEQHLYRATV